MMARSGGRVRLGGLLEQARAALDVGHQEGQGGGSAGWWGAQRRDTLSWRNSRGRSSSGQVGRLLDLSEQGAERGGGLIAKLLLHQPFVLLVLLKRRAGLTIRGQQAN